MAIASEQHTGTLVVAAVAEENLVSILKINESCQQ